MICRFDCGLLVIKYMEMWDGLCSFKGKNMPIYITVCKYLVLLVWLCVFLIELMKYGSWFTCSLSFKVWGSSWFTNGSCMKITVAMKLFYLLWT